jgi:mRNA interferase MazF
MAGRVRRGEIRLVSFPAPDKKRPALVLTRDSAIAVLTRVTVAPITTTVRGIPSEVVLTVDDGMKATCAVNLDNVATIPQRVLGRRVAQLGPERMREVCAALSFAVGCDT